MARMDADGGGEEDVTTVEADDNNRSRDEAGDADSDDEAYLFISRLPPLNLCTPPDREAALPAKQAGVPGGTLVLDLDETLVHSSLDPQSGTAAWGPHDFSFPVLFEDAQHTVFVRTRPGLQARGHGG